MTKLTIDVPAELHRQIERIIRDGWFVDEEVLLREAIFQFVDGKSFLGDSPRMLHRFAADSMNESKPETALKFVDRALSLLSDQKITDFTLYQSLVELRVQILLVLHRQAEALTTLEDAREQMPNNPSIAKWIDRLNRNRDGALRTES